MLINLGKTTSIASLGAMADSAPALPFRAKADPKNRAGTGGWPKIGLIKTLVGMLNPGVIVLSMIFSKD